jgi:broad specificity phosphatase PhoE
MPPTRGGSRRAGRSRSGASTPASSRGATEPLATLLLVRHGVTAATGKRAGGRTDAALTDDGVAQAEAVAERLSVEDIAAVYTSPIRRARETAERITTRLGLEPRELTDIQELDHGRWTDRPLKQMARTKHFARVVRTPSRTTLPDGESFVAAQGRAVLAIEGIIAAHPEREAVVAVSHADIIKLLVAHYAGTPLDAFQRLIVSPASITRLMLPREGMPRIESVNVTSHLEVHE